MRTGLILLTALLILAVPRTIIDPDQPMCLCEFVAPIYPPIARLSRMQGIIRMKATVGSTGKLQEVEVLQDGTMQPTAMEILQRASANAIRKWRFCPSQGTSNHSIVVTFKFTLLDDVTSREADQWYPTDVSFQFPATVEITTTNATVRTD